MRVSLIGWVGDDVDEVLAEAERSPAVTHNHPEGIKGAQATALAVYLAREGESKQAIRQEIATRFGYDLSRTPEEVRPSYRFDVTCQGSVPESLIAFFESESYEEAIRKAISLGGDADTMSCIAGGVAEAFYGGIPDGTEAEARHRLPGDLAHIVVAFYARFVRWGADLLGRTMHHSPICSVRLAVHGLCRGWSIAMRVW